MIQVIEGKKHEEFVNDMCIAMCINNEHKINFYINSDLENSMSVENGNEIRINIKENKDTKYNIIYMLQKYRYCWICDEENKDKRVLNIINSYLANYYKLTLPIDLFSISDDLFLQDQVIKLKEQICNVCRANIIKFDEESEKDNIDEIACLSSIGANCACWNTLKKYDEELAIKSTTLSDVMEKLEWFNINELYSEIEQVFYSYLD
ncbi:hypothetical protein GKZ28_13195 [Clostridium chromiireducens]|uniref:Uncharacterized protein n=1 Tax=Clostridium chromiireducens TaxID=225345 RepID=A0A964RML6_9CLOT|nr:hypothetical protein [Clostridium chromiireducens]MVX64649.1 hypothetical protein [Clostridium chromiireducens]